MENKADPMLADEVWWGPELQELDKNTKILLRRHERPTIVIASRIRFGKAG